MSYRYFWTSLFTVTVSTVGILYLIDIIAPDAMAFNSFSLLTTGVFAVIVGTAYILALRSVGSKNKYAFVQLVMGLIIVKMAICVLLVVFHIKTAQPESKLFVLPFLMVYLIFTIFEVYVLQKVARMTPAGGAG